jgi:micrococcal nuclease
VGTVRKHQNRIISRIWLAIVFICLIGLAGCLSPPETAAVINVIDGDTIIIEGNYRVRYIGIDTPEIRPALEAYGLEAWQANRELVQNRTVRLERDVSETDRYGRLLRYVYVDDVFVNAELVRLGLAEAVAYPPDTRYQDYFEELETTARKAGLGIWPKR